MDSLAGSPLYSAPEIIGIATLGIRDEYTNAVDLYSLGRCMMVMLWRTRFSDSRAALRMPEDKEYNVDTRFPPAARVLIGRLTASQPSLRSTASRLEEDAFFKATSLAPAAAAAELRQLLALDFASMTSLADI